jgi:hypothetical protein
VSVVIADLTSSACCDRSAIWNLLKARRKATARGGQVRFAIRPGGLLHLITDFAGTQRCSRSTLRHALTGPVTDTTRQPRASRRPRSAPRHLRRPAAGPPCGDDCKPDYPDARSDGLCTAQRSV